MTQPTDSFTDEASGYVTDSFESIDMTFTEQTVLHRSERNIVVKAKRYGRWWILKGLLPEADTEANRMALRKEFEVMMMLSCDGVVRACSMENVAGVGTCIVMDYIAGPTLNVWLSGRTTTAQRTRLARKLTEAIGRMHGCGVVHRDIKPANIIVEATADEPVLIDFGLADTFAYAHLKNPAGTKNYMSPEQEFMTTPDARNDIYSLGCVLRQMRLTLVWQPVIRRCLKPLDERPATARAVLDKVSSLRFLLGMAGTLLGICTLVVSVIFISRSAARTPDQVSWTGSKVSEELSSTRIQAERAVMRADSLQMKLDSMKSSGRQEMDNMQARVTELSDGTEVRREQEAKEAAEIDAAVKEGCKRIDAVWNATAMHYLDTLRGPVPRGFDWTTTEMLVAKLYFESELGTKLSTGQIAKIDKLLNDRIEENYNRWTKQKLLKELSD